MNIHKHLKQLSQISQYLMLNGSFTNSLGLLNGKMGIILFFFHYSKYAKNPIYKKFAEEMINEIYSEISQTTSCSFGDGLCGIAWGLMYLVRNGFVKTDDEFHFLEALDVKIMEWDVRHIKDATLERGTAGVGHFILSRFAVDGSKCYLPDEYINEYVYAAKCNNNQEVLQLMNRIRSGQIDLTSYMNNQLISFLASSTNFRKKMQKPNIGISSSGYAGLGLNLILNDE